MSAKVFVLFLLINLLLSCQNNIVQTYNYDQDTPAWLKSKIDSMITSGKNYYFGTEVNRYKWKDSMLVEFNIPLSSCMLCELYYYHGTKTDFKNDNTVLDYMNNKTDKVLIWHLSER